ncbi:MAG: ligand-binding sensor domain-containing protein [Armatimonadota bacterium]
MKDTLFVQEIAERYSLGSSEANDVRAIAVAPDGDVWAATRAGFYRWRKGQNRWTSVSAETAPAFAAFTDSQGNVWLGAWNGLYRATNDGLRKVAGISLPVSVLCEVERELIAFGPDGMWRVRGDSAIPHPLPCASSIRCVLPDGMGGVWIGTNVGLFHHTPEGTVWRHSEEHLLSSSVRGLAIARDGSLWIGGLGGITIYREGKRAGQLTPADGLPSVQVQCVRRAPDGRMWIGTPVGVTRTDGKSWSLRHSLRWLPDDDVRDVAFDADGTAWVATAGGVSAIRQHTMTLAEKADYYLGICLARHVREPGLVEKCLLQTPGDVSTWKPRDDDNDGEYTGMYLAMECFRYVVTKDPSARANARKAFEALRFLQTVTGTRGFVARTVIPSNWQPMNDPNRTYTDAEWADEHVRDPRHKRVHERWRLSADGKWLWKGDTSSDEITGHFYGYLHFYDLAADEQDKQRVREHVRRVMDTIIEGGYVLKDIDGTHTRWAVWSPEKLNGDPNWAPERGINSAEILSFLKTTYHITGDPKYEREYRKLLDEHGYRRNVKHAKTFNPAWRTHIDDELLALAFPALLLYETDPELKQLYRQALDTWYEGVKNDQNPWFHFLYASLTNTPPEIRDSLMFLRDAPLDLVRWTIDNTRREDLKLVRRPEMESWQTDRLPPPSERGVMRWDENPWVAVQGDGGQTESDGVFWLLPYWMGRYYGYILPPEK